MEIHRSTNNKYGKIVWKNNEGGGKIMTHLLIIKNNLLKKENKVKKNVIQNKNFPLKFFPNGNSPVNQ